MPQSRRDQPEDRQAQKQAGAAATEQPPVQEGDQPTPTSAAAPSPDQADAPLGSGANVPDIEVGGEDPPTVIAVRQRLDEIKAGKDEQEPVSRLIEESQGFFGQPSHVAAGAFAALPEDTEALTRAQGRAVIEAWLGAPVGGAQPEQEAQQ